MDGEREGDVIDSRADADQPVSVGARTRRGVLARLGFAAVAACLLDLEFALGLGLSDWALAVGAAGTVGWRSRSAMSRAAWLGLPMSSGFTVPPDSRAWSLANIAAAAATCSTVPPGARPIMLSVDIRA